MWWRGYGESAAFGIQKRELAKRGSVVVGEKDAAVDEELSQ